MTDPSLPRLHVRPARGWLNDPNGLARVGDRWHVFFQHNPRSPRHEDVGWGHWSSPDLVTWREEPMALVPRPGHIDAGGCWSGTLVLDAGVPTVCYTAIPGEAGETTPGARAVAAVARGDADLRHWVAATEASAPRVGPATAETRDPYVVSFAGRRWVIQGHGGPETPARLLVHAADDLSSWGEPSTLLDLTDPVAAAVAGADLWECPSLVELGDGWLLLVSLWRWNGHNGDLCGVRWFHGDLTLGTQGPRFTARHGGTLDDGPAHYAAQALQDGSRVLVWAWSWELGRDEAWLTEHGWSGVLTTPRELRWQGDRVEVSPAAEHLQHRREQLPASWSVAEAGAFEVHGSGAGRLRCDPVDGGLDTVVLGPGAVRVLVDGSLVEVFGDGGVHTTRVYPMPGSRWHLESDGDHVAHRFA